MYTKTNSDGGLVPAFGGGNLADLEILTADKTLQSYDSGKTFLLNAAAGKTVLLPALTKGFNAKFIIGAAFATSNWVLTNPSAVIQGSVIVNGANVAVANKTNINFVNTADSLGDWVSIVCDGTNVYVSGNAIIAGAVTVS